MTKKKNFVKVRYLKSTCCHKKNEISNMAYKAAVVMEKRKVVKILK
jgi:hypothetical protein